MISTQITRLVFFLVVRAGTEQEETEGSDLKKEAICRILIFWFIMKIQGLFPYLFNLHSILHLLFCIYFCSLLVYIYVYVGLSMGNPYKIYVCQNAWSELHGPNTCMLKVSFGWLKPTCDTRIIQFYYTLEQL